MVTEIGRARGRTDELLDLEDKGGGAAWRACSARCSGSKKWAEESYESPGDPDWEGFKRSWPPMTARYHDESCSFDMRATPPVVGGLRRLCERALIGAGRVEQVKHHVTFMSMFWPAVLTVRGTVVGTRNMVGQGTRRIQTWTVGESQRDVMLTTTSVFEG
jgi:hypothetical protein